MRNHLLPTFNKSVKAALLFVLVSAASQLYAQQGGSSLQFVPPNYSPYQSDQVLTPQSRDELSRPYSMYQPPVEQPVQRRPYAYLPPSGGNYGNYNRPNYGGGYPGGGYRNFGNPSSAWGGMPWGGSYPGGPGGGMPWGGSPWGNSFNMFGAPGGFPFGW